MGNEEEKPAPHCPSPDPDPATTVLPQTQNDIPTVLIGPIGPRYFPATDTLCAELRRNLIHTLEKTVIHLGSCHMGLESRFQHHSTQERSDGNTLFTFKYTKNSCLGYVHWGPDELVFEVDKAAYLSCEVDGKCEKCDHENRNAGNEGFHRTSMRLPGGQEGCDFQHRFDGFDGTDVHEDGVTFTLSWIRAMLDATPSDAETDPQTSSSAKKCKVVYVPSA